MNAFLETLSLWLADFFVLASVLLAASLALRSVAHSRRRTRVARLGNLAGHRRDCRADGTAGVAAV